MTDGDADYASLLVPEGTRLIHIGPHKTGTTSLQAALFNGRASLLEQGVRHIGKSRNPASAVRAVTGQNAPTSTDTPPSIRFWHDLVGDFRRAREPRVVVSSEFFAWSKPPVIERIARDLDGSRLHVVVTLRPLGRILPSHWQQNVQAGSVHAYEDWLRLVFDGTPGGPRLGFWQLHRHDELIARWAAVLGRERVTAIVVDEGDHAMVLRVFEGLLGLRPGTLVVDRDMSNRSLTLAEVEAVRAFNAASRRLGVTRAVHARTMRFGAATHMKQRRPGPEEARIETPQWALDRAREAELEMVPVIASSGVRVVGNLDELTASQVGLADGRPAAPVVVTPEIAAEMAVGVLIATGQVRSGSGPVAVGSARVEPIEVARLSSRQLAAVITRRARGRVGGRLAALRHTVGRRNREI